MTLIQDISNNFAPELISAGTADAIHNLLSQPIEVRRSHAGLRNIAQFFSSSINNSVGRIQVRDIFKIMGFPAPASMTEQLADDIGQIIEMSCYQYAPNRRLHGTSFEINDIILLTPALQAPEFNHACDIMVILVRLGAIIAKSDNRVSNEEIGVLQNMILSRKVFTDDQRASLLLWLHWCLYTPQRIDNIQQNLSALPEELRQKISQILVRVACADGKLEPTEKTHLCNLHKLLGFPATWVDLELANQQFGGVRIPTVEDVEHAVAKENAFASPYTPRPSRPSLEAVSISPELNQALSSVCDLTPIQPIKQIFTQQPSADSSAPQQMLDKPHLMLLHDMAQKDSWPRLQVFELAIKQNLMADWAMSKLNEIADQKYGKSMITDGAIVQINTILANRLYHDLSETT